MAETTRRNSDGSQPISQHPLFPAIVALWFGALAGLGSLALKPALLERFVVASGIDSIIPMAAPPLGTTTRILLALAMTGLGGVIGALLARRIARPRPQIRERRRGTASRSEAIVEASEANARAQSSFAGRRRALALKDEGAAYDLADRAPVPGHASGILDVSEFALDGFEDDGTDDRGQARAVEALEPDALSNDWLTAVGRDAPLIEADAEAEAEADADFEVDAYADTAEKDFAAPVPEGAQVFSPFAKDVAAASGGAEAGVENITPRHSTSSLFDSYSQQIADRAEQARGATAPRLFDNAASGSDATTEPGFELLPRLNLGNWGDDENEADAEATGAPAPLFPTRESLRNANQPKPEIVQPSPDANDDGMSELVAFAADGTATPPPASDETHAHTQQVMGEAERETVPETVEAEPNDLPSGDDGQARSAAARIASSELGELSQVELLERLALAMASRREEVQARHAAQAAAAASSEAVQEVQPEEAEFAQSETGRDHAASSDLGAPASRVEVPRVDISPLAVEPLTFEAPRFEAPAQADEAAVAAQSPAAAPFSQVPAALRPVGYDDFDDADEVLPGYIPPRHIGMADPASGLTDLSGDEAGEADDEETRVLEEGYSSLLNLSRPSSQHGFVRIEEPESDAIEPVVVFPGEEARPMGGPFSGAAADTEAAPESASVLPAEPVASGERLFDAPAKADPEETERALRAALATLQRMSGAA